MKISPLPEILTVKMQLISPKHSDEVLEIVKIDDMKRITLARASDMLIFHKQLNRQALVNWDYQLANNNQKGE